MKKYSRKQLKDFLLLAWNNKTYLPTAWRTWRVLRNAEMTPWNEGFEIPYEMDNPFKNAKEERDLTERANWLCENVIVDDPEKLIARMPEFIGRQFQGEWAIYACSMTVAALSNIIRLYPEAKERNNHYLTSIISLIEIVNTPTLRFYDTMCWGEDAIDSLDGNDSHMTYLSILAWMIGNFKLAGGDSRYDELHKILCDTLNRRMAESADLNLPSFPNGVIFLPDMMFAVLSLRDYGIIHNHEYDDMVNAWLNNAKTQWIDHSTGLLYSSYNRNLCPGRGSGAYSGLNCTCLAMLDPEFGKKQYDLLKRTFVVKFGKYIAVKEYSNTDKRLSFDIDAGTIIYGLSPTGIAFSLGAATYFNDWHFRAGLLNMAELAGNTVRSMFKRKRHYRLAEILLTGEAITLAMRTTKNFG